MSSTRHAEAAISSIDIGGTSIESGAVGILDGNLELLGSPLVVPSQQPSSLAHIRRFAEHIGIHSDTASRHSLQLAAVCIAVPNPTNFEQGIIKVPHKPNLEALFGVAINSMLEEETGLPAFLLKDADAAGLGAMRRDEQLAGKTPNTALYLGLGTGPGAALFENGSLQPGFEVYDQKVGQGTFEETAHAAALTAAFAEIKHGQPSLTPLEIGRIALVSQHPAQASAREVYRQYGRKLGEDLARALGNQAVYPELIAVGGGISGSWGLFGETAVEAYLRTTGQDNKEVVFQRTSVPDIALFGAAAYAFERMGIAAA